MQRENPQWPVLKPQGVILSVAVFQAERRIFRGLKSNRSEYLEMAGRRHSHGFSQCVALNCCVSNTPGSSFTFP
jgi:hypothetical protein